MKIGFIGLGKLGTAMLKRLSTEGYQPVVYNRTKEKAVQSGFEYVTTPKDLTYKDIDCIVVNVFDSNAVEDIFNGTDGLLAGNLKNKIIIDTTTNHFECVKDFYRLSRNAGADYLEAPVIGSVIPAEKGQLMILVSGDKGIFERCRPLLEKIGSQIIHYTEEGKATKMKLINNMVMGGFMAVLSEALSVAGKLGFSTSETLELLSAGAGESKILNLKKSKLINEDYSPHFDIKTLVKDLYYMNSMSFSINQPSILSGVLKELYTMAGAKKSFEDDFAAIYEFMKNNR
jgi:3-hydroxyisobutyrate dehydrogenase